MSGSLRAGLALMFATAVAVLVAAGGVLLVHQLNSGLDAALDLSLTARADALAQQVGPGGTVTDFQDTGGGPGSLLSPSETLAQVIGPDGALIESSEGSKSASLLTGSQLRAARAGVVAVTTTLPDGVQARLLAVPVTNSGIRPSPVPIVVVVGTSRELGMAAVNRVRTGLLIAGPLAALLGGVGAWLVAGAVLRPVERMRAQAAAISAGDPSARLVLGPRRDEITRLGVTFNELLARLQQALTQQRTFVADAGHELRTPLTLLRAELELAARPGRDRASLASAVRAASADTDRLIRLAEDLLTLARADDPRATMRHEPVPLHEVTRDAVNATAARVHARGVRLDMTLSTQLVPGDPDRLRQVIDNLLDNALRHGPDHGTITVTLAAAGQGMTSLRVADDGPGFPPRFASRAFDRFTRADPARGAEQGTGLGLAIVAAIVAAHSGRVTADNRRSGGALVEVLLPTIGQRADPREPAAQDVNVHTESTSLPHHVRRTIET